MEGLTYLGHALGALAGPWQIAYALGATLAGIVQQIYYRFYHGQTQDKRFASFVQMNALLERMTLQVIARSDL